MGDYARAFGPHAPDATYVDHGYDEQLYDTGEAELNHVVVGDPAKPALLLVPGQTESWWGYLDAHSPPGRVFPGAHGGSPGQGRSTRTPGRYTLNLMGNDLVRFIDGVIGRPTVVSGLSSGGVLAAWLSAYAKPGQVLAAHYEDLALVLVRTGAQCGSGRASEHQTVFELLNRYLGDQWCIGDWHGLDGCHAARPSHRRSSS